MDGRRHSTFEVNGKVYNVRISFNALADFNRQGGNLEDFQKAPLSAYRGILCAGINAYGSTSITLDQAGDLCEDFIREKGQKMFISVMKDIMETAQDWLGKLGDDKGKNPSQTPIIPAASEHTSKTAKPSRTGSAG
jgi:hypothetical protein